MIESKHYTKDFFSGHEGGSFSSAKKIIPIVQDIIKPSSVIDVGCGIGYWLKAWNENFGLTDLLGIDGPYVLPSMLKVPKEMVVFQDLKLPISLTRKFDLAMSLEVAEHLPESLAKSFIKSLTGLSDVILFSAAIVGQEGTFHINEQPPEYWAKIFWEYGYVPVDIIRDKVWNDPDVEWWYQQNVLLYIKKERLNDYPDLAEAASRTFSDKLLRIHPWIFYYKHEYVIKTKSFLGYIRSRLYPVKQFLKGKKDNQK